MVDPNGQDSHEANTGWALADGTLGIQTIVDSNLAVITRGLEGNATVEDLESARAAAVQDSANEARDNGALALAVTVATAAGGPIKQMFGRIRGMFSRSNRTDVWDRSLFADTQRGVAIEDALAGSDYRGWTRAGQQNNGFSEAWDFNQGSTWVSLKTVNTTGSGWMSRMNSSY